MGFEQPDANVDPRTDGKPAPRPTSLPPRLAAEVSIRAALDSQNNTQNQAPSSAAKSPEQTGWNSQAGQASQTEQQPHQPDIADFPLSYEHQPAPPVPPGVSEYRHMFMEEPSSQRPEDMAAERQTLPPTYQYEQAAENVQLTKNMRQSDLLKVAKSIKVDGVRLKDVFAAKRIDTEGLRAIIETYLRGGDVKQQLSQEIIAKEQSFERDPYLRKQRIDGHVSAHGTGTGTRNRGETGVASVAREVLQGVVKNKSAQLKASSQKTAKKAKRVLADGAKQAQNDIIDNSNIVDWLSITAIVIVYSLILILLLK